MPQTTFIHEGDFVDFVPAVDVAVGEVVVQGDLLGVAPLAIPAGKSGVIAVVGVFDFTKSAGAAIAVGAPVYWDNANKVATGSAGGNKLLGKAVKAAAAADATVRVRLSQ